MSFIPVGVFLDYARAHGTLISDHLIKLGLDQIITTSVRTATRMREFVQRVEEERNTARWTWFWAWTPDGYVVQIYCESAEDAIFMILAI